ncbi:GNAT family N-acetyltransferase [Streptococcus oricebi]|uniref:GNAT family N-acetyltransferase n=1 Tax=Streptococcus oricebi TaxID=1547447 RepID=A0ABS5B3P1_9STRE|nr:GNAT family N-acetyltransferase [Streptococcus oricebi]MBP2623446.1 GNAT family N-acetyltransferase [Streptococcus oricebi]
MVEIKLVPVTSAEEEKFIKEIQEAFQTSFEQEFGPSEGKILPEADIRQSFESAGSEAFFAVENGQKVGGLVLVIDEKTGCNHLDFLYVKVGCQSKGLGQAIWQAVEHLHPETKVWETHTPYYEKRNIHFYVNRCGFQIVEFFNSSHLDPHAPAGQLGALPVEIGKDFFRFEKLMKPSEK